MGIRNYIDKAAGWILSRASDLFVIAEYHKRASGGAVDYKRQSVALSKKEIDNFIRAVMAGTDPENPRLGDWMRFVENMRLDGHLMSCVENRIMPVQCAPFKLVDVDNNEDTEAQKLLERPWHLEMVNLVCSHTFTGVKLICMFDVGEDGHLAKVEEVPQSNFIPQKGVILVEESDQDGISYRQGAYRNYYFQVGGDWNLGIFSQLAMVVLAKKLGLGSWMSYIDKFGVPPLFAITERMDTQRRDELFAMLEAFRMNHFAVLQGNEKIEIPNGYNVDAHNTFKSLMTDICDKEISKRVLGSSGLTDEKSYVGAAEVQERILEYRHKVDKLLYKFYFNTEIKPRLVKLSPVYAPLANLSFEYDESETLSMKEILEAVKGLAPYFEFDVAELAKISGLPITRLRATISEALGAAGSATGSAGGTEKKKNSPTGLAPAVTSSAFDFGSARPLFAATWEKAYAELLEGIRRGEIKEGDIDREFILKTYDRLNKAAELGYGRNYYSDSIARNMRENLLRFAATKTYVQQQEVRTIRKSAADEQTYRTEGRKYLERQNETYLDVQAAWSARSAQSAREYRDFVRDRDIYPNLRFRTMRDDRVRRSHAELEGLILSIDDPRLDEYMPPLDPRCRCWLEQTREAVTDFDPEFEPDPQWAGNPGKTGVIFNDRNSYNEAVENNEVRLSIRGQAELTKEYLPYNRVIEAGEAKVYVNDFADPVDLEQNIRAAEKIARELVKDVYVRHHLDGGLVPGHKNPEFSIGRKSAYGDLKTYDGESIFGNFVKAGIKNANRQGAQYVVLDVSRQKDLSTLGQILRGSLKDRNHNIARVILIRENKVAEITRKQIDRLDFSAIEPMITNKKRP